MSTSKVAACADIIRHKALGKPKPKPETEDMLNAILALSHADRCRLNLLYKEKFNVHLILDIGRFASGDYAELLKHIFWPVEHIETAFIQGALRGTTSHKALRQILLTKRTQQEIDVINDTFLQGNIKPLADVIRNKQTDLLGDIYYSILTTPREKGVNPEMAKKQAEELFHAAQAKPKEGTNQCTFNRILCKESYEQLELIFNQYEVNTNNHILRVIDKFMDGDLKQAYYTIVKCILDKATYYADLLHDAITGISVSNGTIIRIIVTQHEKDLALIDKAYMKKYLKNLTFVIGARLTGHYKELLIKLIEKAKKAHQ